MMKKFSAQPPEWRKINISIEVPATKMHFFASYLTKGNTNKLQRIFSTAKKMYNEKK